MKKIILVNPGIGLNESLTQGLYPNTAIMILATILHNNGFCVKVVDGRYEKADSAIRSIVDAIDENLIFIGFSVMTVQLPWAYYVSNAVKSKCPKACIVWGGAHPTLFPEQTAEDKAVDIVVVNDSADKIVPLSKCLAENLDLSGIPGLYYMERNNLVSTAPNQNKDDFNSIPYIDFSLIDHKKYSRNNNLATEEFYGGVYNNTRAYPIITALGCPHRCNFCINVILKKKYRYRSAGEIVERIRFLQREYNADFIQPLDENFFINKKRTCEFLDLLEKDDIRIKWRPQTRVDYFRDDYINIDVLRRLDRAGMVVAAMGVESASQEMLDKLNKELRVEQIVKGAELLSKTNIVPKMNFMVGLPGETKEDINKTYKLAVKIRRIVKRSCVSVSTFRPYPGSPLYDEIVSKYGYSPPSSLKDWSRLSEKEFTESVGYESYENYKWIHSPRRLKAMRHVYNRIDRHRPLAASKLSSRVFKYIMDTVSYVRFDLNCFCFVDAEERFFKIMSKVKNFAARLILRSREMRL